MHMYDPERGEFCKGTDTNAFNNWRRLDVDDEPEAAGAY
jgi:hypothetical protein